ncbi:Gldg family protein [Desulfospira joergensenii]|uniref:Gldg family protein n=1 Tax=Desulfospira joergensenii TaxID=53329 RepID=UPI000415EFF6|nr:Gldg family protein [Desulfospira joergensenii]
MTQIKEHYIKFILYTAVIVLVNLAGLTLFFRADLTKAKVYSLSEASKEVVATLSEPLSIKVFFSKDLPAPHNNTERYLRDLMEEYGARAGKYFNYTFYNVSPEEGGLTDRTDANREMAKSYGISPVQIRIMENDEVKFKNAYMGLVIIHGDLIEKIGAITSTDGLEYQLTTAIQKLNDKVSALLRLKDKIKVKMILSSSLNPIAPLLGLEDRLPGLAKGVEKVIRDLNTRSMGIIDFEHLDLTTKKDLDAIAGKYNLMALSWPAIPERNIGEGQGAAGLVLEYKGKTETLPLISAVELPIIGTTYQMADPEALEEELTTIIEKMIGINKDIGYLADHGSQSLGPDRMAMMQGRPGGGMQVFNSLLSSRYDIKPVSLKEDPIPEGLNCLIIAKPTEKFSDYELFQIDQALMKGTNIAFFGDAFNEIMPQGGMGMPQYPPIDTGLEKLLSHYGIAVEKAFVLDKSAYKHQASPSQGGGEQAIYFAPMIKEKSINNEPEFMNNIKGLIAMQISPLELKEENIDKDRVTAVRLLSSSDESWLMKGMINLNPMFISPPESKEKMESYDLAYILEGEFTSYFKGKPVPEKETGEKEIQDKETPEKAESGPAEASPGAKELVARNRVIESSKPAKIFVLGCSQMLQDNMLDPEGRSTNATFILNVLDHLNGRDKIAAMRSKQQTLNPIVQTTPFVRGMIKGFNIAGLPVLVILFGMGVLVSRNARKKKIARMFKENK